MPITARDARRLSTAGEWTLIEHSQPGRIKALSAARLRMKIARARKLRDKYVDLVKRQHRAARATRRGGPGESRNVRTQRKAELFAQVLARFEARLNGLMAAVAKAGTRSSRQGDTRQARKKVTRQTPAAPKAAVRTPMPGKAARASKAPKRAVATRSAQHRIHAHVSSLGRRRQGRRDNRSR